jgi:hypothetical protein
MYPVLVGDKVQVVELRKCNEIGSAFGELGHMSISGVLFHFLSSLDAERLY